MPHAIDHVLIACPDPDEAAGEFEARLGLQATGSGRHTALGTFNQLIWLGDSFIELIGIEARKLAEASWVGRPVLHAADAGGGFAMWAAATRGIHEEVATLRAGGSDLGDPVSGERVRPDGRIVRWTLAESSSTGPLEPPFLIEHDMTAAEWSEAEQAGRAAQRQPIGGPVRFETLELPAPDIPPVTRRYLRTVGIGPFRPSLVGRGARDATIGPHTIRFVPGPAEGWPIATIHLVAQGSAEETADAEGTVLRDVELLGCRWIIRAG
ncbi:MAG TPA: VOC family protein [Candidatus Limnocylindrales bacterium]